MAIKFEPLNRREKIVKLFREAIEAENARDLKTAKRKLDEIMELARKTEPEFYFEACFRMADVFIQENNYRGAVKCAIRGIYNAPNRDLYLSGIKRLGDILFIMKRQNRLGELPENMDITLSLVKDDEELHSFVSALVRLARGEEVKEDFKLKEFREIIEALKE
ncbi:hypothetical protein [Thermococcus piezophilus]|uniref:Tetratricopeptide repeat protein n=1 Tax=Thermococcus piezophilus TaxID=1712654 RepID=A0A172WFI0_9EURY|nr:hypothetical protein [Thermococcus piezophilus]ANF22190.1 hypothetical protein A7C91_02555 [Thermococcus piezophilus]